MSDEGNGAASGAASGAAAGTAVAPGWGTLIGAVAGGAMGYMGASSKKKAMAAALARQRRILEQERKYQQQQSLADQSYYGGEARARQGELGTTINAALGVDPGLAQEQATNTLGGAMQAVGPMQGSAASAQSGGGAAASAEAAEAALSAQQNGRLAGAMGVSTGNEMAQTERQGAMNQFSMAELMRSARMGDYNAKRQLWEKIHQLELQRKMGAAGMQMNSAQNAGDGYLFAGQMMRTGGALAGAMGSYNQPSSAQRDQQLPEGAYRG